MTEEHFIKLYDEFSDAIFRYCYVKTSHRETAQDIMQDAYARVWEYVGKGGEIQNSKAFLYKTANNLIIDHYRKKKSDSLDSLQEKGFDPASTEHADIGTEAEVKRVIAVINTLDEKYRDALIFRFVEGLGPKEIALITGEQENAVSVRIYRGIAQLREVLTPESDGEQNVPDPKTT